MLLEPSRLITFQDRRQLLYFELETGGHGQIPLTGTGIFTPHAGYTFYRVDFLASSVVGSVTFDDQYQGSTVYRGSTAQYVGLTFPALYSWDAPINAIKLNSGSAIAYEYQRLSETCGDGC